MRTLYDRVHRAALPYQASWLPNLAGSKQYMPRLVTQMTHICGTSHAPQLPFITQTNLQKTFCTLQKLQADDKSAASWQRLLLPLHLLGWIRDQQRQPLPELIPWQRLQCHVRKEAPQYSLGYLLNSRCGT